MSRLQSGQVLLSIIGVHHAHNILFAVHLESFLQLAGQAPVIDHQTVVLVHLSAVDTAHGLEESMLPQRAVQVHHLLNRGIKTGDELIADDQNLGVILFLELPDDLLFLCLGTLIGLEICIVVMDGGDQDLMRWAMQLI